MHLHRGHGSIHPLYSQSIKLAEYNIAAGSAAAAATTVVYAIAPVSSSLRTTLAIVDCFLTNSYVYTFNARVFLRDDRIDRHSCFTSLTVTDDQLTLTTAAGMIVSTDL